MSATVNEKIYIIGGWTEYEDNSALVQEYDPTIKSWTQKARMPTARSFTEATVMNDTIFVAGGRGGNGNAFESYDPITDTWTVWDSMPISREGVSVGGVNNRIFVTAGSDNSGFPLYNENNEASDFSLPASEDKNPIPRDFSCVRGFPNPFSTYTTIHFHLPYPENIYLGIFDTSGGLINTLVNDRLLAGTHTIVWDGRDASGKDVPSGIYLTRVISEKFNSSERLVILK
jgi:hypothetical protein